MPAVARFVHTPNPNAIKVILESPLPPRPHSPRFARGVPRSFTDRAAASVDPVASAMLSIPGVVGVLISEDGRWVTLSRAEGASWSTIQDDARLALAGVPG